MAAELTLRGAITKTETTRRKETYNGMEGGDLLLTVRVERPAAPKRPRAGWNVEKVTKAQTVAGVEAALEKIIAAEGEEAADIELVRDYLEQLVEWEGEKAEGVDALRAWATAVAVAAALEGEPVKVTLRPDGDALQQLLPGLTALSAGS